MTKPDWHINNPQVPNHVNLQALGEECNKWADVVEQAMEVRKDRNPNQFYDVYYTDLVQDPLSTVRQIYEYFGYNFTPTMKENIKLWISSNQKHRKSLHRYSLML